MSVFLAFDLACSLHFLAVSSRRLSQRRPFCRLPCPSQLFTAEWFQSARNSDLCACGSTASSHVSVPPASPSSSSVASSPPSPLLPSSFPRVCEMRQFPLQQSAPSSGSGGGQVPAAAAAPLLSSCRVPAETSLSLRATSLKPGGAPTTSFVSSLKHAGPSSLSSSSLLPSSSPLSPTGSSGPLVSVEKGPSPDLASLSSCAHATGPGVSAGSQSTACEVCEAVQNILREMDSRFTSMTEAILNRLDDMSGKIDNLEEQLQSLLNDEQEGSAGAGEMLDAVQQ
ncbi:hypothetical protein NCLIV_054660 [Neospora caninum Liverpool]|uniref:Heat shock factor binding protein 1 protein n=2 Tax=Neospora caninum (strain Liverpool) TaxID=572307 RepID=F0VMU5_NEOCL|nr:hypothetical protein NCLIV_054660 [Neospora caninum Liverpool]CBZ55041.1 hypothetical protein NCLIV_054660 [Neospora caninum Liverpool]|eukprot:XP_003885069.1 hypothetical protein NCLIV_054660 [Neospora caninum Liverpool]